MTRARTACKERGDGELARPRTRATKKVEDYRHDDAKRLNNPPAGLAWQDTEKPVKRRFEYDPHLDPQLVWAGKAERQSFEVEAPSIHVHERLSADDIVRSVMKEPAQPALFDYEELDRTKAVDFYRHEMGWENRLILGDALVVMTSLLEKERLAGQVQMIYVDPPYGIDFKANFQRRISSPDVKNREADLTREPEQVQAYRDTWALGVHSYLTYLRDRVLAARELLTETGSLFVQIGDDHVNRVTSVLDEVMGAENRVSIIAMQKSGSSTTTTLPRVLDYILWYAKDVKQLTFRPLYEPFDLRSLDTRNYRWFEDEHGERHSLSKEQRENPASIPSTVRPYRLVTATSQDWSSTRSGPYQWNGKEFTPGKNRHWSLSDDDMDRLGALDRLHADGNTLQFIRYLDDFPVQLLRNIWLDTGRSGFGEEQRYAVQTNPKAIERCVLMTTDPGDLVLDPTCGSGTTAFCAEKHGRRWMTVDTSRVAVAIARERMVTTKFDYYVLAHPEEGVAGGFEYETVRRIQPSDLASAAPPVEFPMRNHPRTDTGKIRVSGPFTVESLSRYAANPNQDGVPPEPDDPQASEPQDHVQTLLDALSKQGIPRKGGAPAKVLRVEPLSAVGAVHAEGDYEGDDGAKSFAVSLGPRFGPVTVQQIDEALHDAYGFDLVVFAGFAATAEAQEYIAGGKRGRFNVALLEANPDLLVGDLLKNKPSSQTFRLFAAPDIKLDRNGEGEYTVQVLGVDIFDASTGETKFVGDEYVAAWFLDTDYDGMVFHVNQAFFPDGGWEKLAKTLKGTVDEELMEQLQSFQSLPFTPGAQKKAAVRVIDDAGTTSEVVLDLE
jgi:adenine-specific DNA-methyltransferase